MQFTRTAHHAIAFFSTKGPWENQATIRHHGTWKSNNGIETHPRIWSSCYDLNCLIWSNCYLADIQVVTIWMGHHFKDFSHHKFWFPIVDQTFCEAFSFQFLVQTIHLLICQKDLALAFDGEER